MTTTLAFVDCETTGLDPDVHEVWEVALTLRQPDGRQSDHHWFLPVDLGRADARSLEIGRYYERYGRYYDERDDRWRPTPPCELGSFAKTFAKLTAGAHLVGAVPSFDDAFLKRLLRANGACPGWHYHLIDVEALAVGYLAHRDRVRLASPPLVAPPWKSDALTAALGVTVDESTKHTAAGDVAWAMAIYDAVMSPERPGVLSNVITAADLTSTTTENRGA
jgi:hypothetical protein